MKALTEAAPIVIGGAVMLLAVLALPWPGRMILLSVAAAGFVVAVIKVRAQEASRQQAPPTPQRLGFFQCAIRGLWLSAGLGVAVYPAFLATEIREPHLHHVMLQQVAGLVVLSFPVGLLWGAIVLPLFFMATQAIGLRIPGEVSTILAPMSFVVVGYWQWFGGALPKWPSRTAVAQASSPPAG